MSRPAPRSAPRGSAEPVPELSGLVVHWHNEDELAELIAAWPDDPRFELVVVDNGSSRPLTLGTARLLRPTGNLGFAGGVNAAAAAARGEILLLLNPDARPRAGALDELLAGFAAHPEAAGLAPRLEEPDGRSQAAWQLRDVPTPWTLLGQILLPGVGEGGEGEPEAGELVGQPAAAALALRRRRFEAVGEMDERFFPAWFEDVDLAHRLRDKGWRLLYWPRARFVHGLGSSVPRLGYGRFLWIYHRGLCRYLGKHHGAGWVLAARLLLVPASLLRVLQLVVRRPRRAASRREALQGALALLAGTLTGWRAPASLAALTRRPAEEATEGRAAPTRREGR